MILTKFCFFAKKHDTEIRLPQFTQQNHCQLNQENDQMEEFTNND